MVPASSLDTSRPFSRAEARAAGISRREILSSRFHRIFYDAYVSSTVPITARLRAEAALRLSPTGSYASHHTAACLWGGVAPVDADVHVTVPGEAGRVRRQGVKAHTSPGDVEPVQLGGLKVSSPTRTFLDLASAGLDLVALVVLGDSLVKACKINPTKLLGAAEKWHGRGARCARRAAALVRSGVDSPQETRLRMLLVLAGLPEPVVNHILRWPDGAWRMRLDMCYPELKLIVEYDGRQHAESTQQWSKDLKRREQLETEGWRIIVVTGQDLRTCPTDVLARVRDALQARGSRGLPATLSTDWLRYFGR